MQVGCRPVAQQRGDSEVTVRRGGKLSTQPAARRTVSRTAVDEHGGVVSTSHPQKNAQVSRRAQRQACHLSTTRRERKGRRDDGIQRAKVAHDSGARRQTSSQPAASWTVFDESDGVVSTSHAQVSRRAQRQACHLSTTRRERKGKKKEKKRKTRNRGECESPSEPARYGLSYSHSWRLTAASRMSPHMMMTGRSGSQPINGRDAE